MAVKRSISQGFNPRALAIASALAVTVAFLAIAGTAAARPAAAGYVAGGGSDHALTANTTAAHEVVLHRDGSKAVSFVAEPSGAAPATDSGGGFDWGDAMIGAGGALALVALIGAAGITVRSRRQVASAPTHA
jgi:hypothetical protein